MKRLETAETLARSVAQDLFATEAAIDEAMMQIAAFTQRLPTASRAAGFAATRGQTVYESLVEALAAQARVRRAIGDVHGQLAELKQGSAMRSVAIGGGSKEPAQPVRPTGALVQGRVIG